MTTTIYAAKRIITMNPSRPFATHVAVRDGRILCVGSLEEVSSWGDATVDKRFEDKVIMPGLIEGHSHLVEGALWDHTYVGYYDRTAPDGRVWPGLKSLDAVVERLQEAAAELKDPDAALIGWGFDPIFFGEQRLHARDLDRVSNGRRIGVFHASLHFLNVNSAVIEESDLSASTDMQEVMTDADGAPTGELAGMVGMYLAMKSLKYDLGSQATHPPALWNFAKVCQLAGVTTATDLHSPLDDEMVGRLTEETDKSDFPLRVVSAFGGTLMPADKGTERIGSLVSKSTDKHKMGIVKLVLDGSIQGFTARLKWPGHFNGAPNGLWYIAPDEFKKLVVAYNAVGHQLHIHTNGDEATELALDAIEEALAVNPHPDHRHTLQHCQMASDAQFRRMAAMGVGVNLFSNHVYYWGDQHYELTLGPDRAHRIDNAGSAVEHGVDLALHSDAPITAIGPLFTAWCAVNRVTSSGKLLGGDAERLTVEEALYTITMGGAISLKLDHEVGSIEVGKLADFAVLNEDPLEVDAMALKDIGVWGTVVGGEVFEAPNV